MSIHDMALRSYSMDCSCSSYALVVLGKSTRGQRKIHICLVALRLSVATRQDGLQTVQLRSSSRTIGPKVGIIYILGTLGFLLNAVPKDLEPPALATFSVQSSCIGLRIKQYHSGARFRHVI